MMRRAFYGVVILFVVFSIVIHVNAVRADPVVCEALDYLDAAEVMLEASSDAGLLGSDGVVSGFADALGRGAERTAKTIINGPVPQPPCGDYLDIVLRVGDLLGKYGVDPDVLRKYRKHASDIVNKCLVSGTFDVQRTSTTSGRLSFLGPITTVFDHPLVLSKAVNGLYGYGTNTNIVTGPGVPFPGVPPRLDIRYEISAHVEIKPAFKPETLTKVLFFHHIDTPDDLIGQEEIVFPFNEEAVVSKMAPPASDMERHDTWTMRLVINKNPLVNCSPP